MVCSQIQKDFKVHVNPDIYTFTHTFDIQTYR